MRTNWISGADRAATLKQLAAKLAKLNGWLQLQSSVTGDSDYPYHLALQRESDGVMAEDKAASYKGDGYQMMLQARGDTRTTPRWVDMCWRSTARKRAIDVSFTGRRQ